MQYITLIGNLTKDPVEGETAGGTPSTKFCIAVDRKRRSGVEQETDFFYCETYGRMAQNCALYLKKGSKVFVTGELRTTLYSSEEGKTTVFLNVFTDRVQFLSKRQADTFTDVNDENCPFLNDEADESKKE